MLAPFSQVQLEMLLQTEMKWLNECGKSKRLTVDHTNETNKTTTSNNNVRVQGAAAVTELFTVLHFVELPESKVCREPCRLGVMPYRFTRTKMEVSRGKSPFVFWDSPSFLGVVMAIGVLSTCQFTNLFIFWDTPTDWEGNLFCYKRFSSLASNILLSRSPHSVQAASTATQHKFSHGKCGVSLSQSNSTIPNNGRNIPE